MIFCKTLSTTGSIKSTSWKRIGNPYLIDISRCFRKSGSLNVTIFKLKGSSFFRIQFSAWKQYKVKTSYSCWATYKTKIICLLKMVNQEANRLKENSYLKLAQVNLNSSPDHQNTNILTMLLMIDSWSSHYHCYNRLKVQ